jgi:hypothetical protein
VTAEDRELLAHAIWTTGRTRAVDRYPLADALMPVVEAIARRRAAEELRAAADGQGCWCEVRDDYGISCDRHGDVADSLRHRANALEAE